MRGRVSREPARPNLFAAMRRILPLLLLLLAACAKPGALLPGEAPPPPLAAADAGTVVTDYGGGIVPVARYLRLPDGRVVPLDPPPAAPIPIVPAEPEAPPPASAPRRGRPIGTGTAFAVTTDGLAVTNAHVVEACAAVADADGRLLRVVARDRQADLALLATSRRFASIVRFRDHSRVELGEPVLVFGFPYGQALGTGLNVTNGIVTGLTGPGGDASRFQMNAAVQPGNSGGPVVDEAGRLLGVAFGRLDDLAVLRATGSLPQGINFAIRAAEVERFLIRNGVTPARGMAAAGTGPRAVSAAVAPAVFQVVCLD